MSFLKIFWPLIRDSLALGAIAFACSNAQAVVFQAENYNAFYDATPGNSGGAYRSDNVDIEATADSGGGYNVGWIDRGEWLAYSGLTIPTTGRYVVRMRVASPYGATASVDLNGGSIQLGNFDIPARSGGWQDWTTVEKIMTLNAGAYSLGVFAHSGNWNFNWIEVTPYSSDLPTAYPGYTGVYPGYTLKYDDRFDWFNAAVWKKGDGDTGAHQSDCRFTDNNVQIEDGNLVLTVRKEYVPPSKSYDHRLDKPGYNNSCGELRTLPTKKIRYGRIEARIKAPARNTATGYIASLFTYTNEGSPREWEEIDVELEGIAERNNKVQFNLIYAQGATEWHNTLEWGKWDERYDIAPADDWRVYAIEWTPTFIKWYVDGVERRVLHQNDLLCLPCNLSKGQIRATPIPDNPAYLMMNFWITNYASQSFGGPTSGNADPIVTKYDWIRIYQLDSAPMMNY